MPRVEIDDTELAELRKLAGEATKSGALVDALRVKLTDAESNAARLGTLETELGQLKAEKLESVWTGAGITDTKIRRVFELEFTEQSAAETGEKDLGKWLAGLQALDADKRPAHLAPFLGKPAAGAAGAGGQQRTNVIPDTSKGAGAGPSAQAGGLTPDRLKTMTPAEFASAYQQLMVADPGSFGTSLPPGLPAPTK